MEEEAEAEDVGALEVVGERESWELVDVCRRRKGFRRANLARLLEVEGVLLVVEEDEAVEESVAVLPEVPLRPETRGVTGSAVGVYAGGGSGAGEVRRLCLLALKVERLAL